MKTPEIEFLKDIMQSINKGRTVSDKDIKPIDGVLIITTKTTEQN